MNTGCAKNDNSVNNLSNEHDPNSKSPPRQVNKPQPIQLKLNNTDAGVAVVDQPVKGFKAAEKIRRALARVDKSKILNANENVLESEEKK